MTANDINAFEALTSIGSQRGWNGPMTINVKTFGAAILSYSVAGEDLLLRKLFKEMISTGRTGTYVDIGCAAPVQGSNSYLFYTYGWRGLCVDPWDLATEFARFRPEDRYVSAAVGQGGEVYWFRHKFNKGMSRVSSSNIIADADFDPTPNPVSCMRLDNLIAQHLSGRRIDFLSLDVEGSELDVLQSGDWERMRPRIVLMECHDFKFEEPFAPASVEYLTTKGYGLRHKIGANVVLIDLKCDLS